MSRSIKNHVNNVLKKINFFITTNFKDIQKIKKSAADLDFLLELSDKYPEQILKYLPNSKAQLKQDLFVLLELNFKKNGYFVEFGATDGIEFSNTYLLEKEFGWNGILAEPAKCWHHDLKKNRDCNIELKCVWNKSNSTLSFNEVTLSPLSTINKYSSKDFHCQQRKTGFVYNVETISLNDLLDKNKAPKKIDYLSVDTEGSEYEILSNFDFDRYQFKIITVEHNFTSIREKIFRLLSKKGYIRKFKDLSRFDDWYVKSG